MGTMEKSTPLPFSRSPMTLSLLASRRLVITSPPSPSLSACPTLLPSITSFLTPSRTSHALPLLQALDSRKLISSPQLLPAPPLKPHLPLLPLPPPRPPRRERKQSQRRTLIWVTCSVTDQPEFFALHQMMG